MTRFVPAPGLPFASLDRSFSRVVLLLVLALWASGCVSHRLDGPIHGEDDPPWIASGAGGAVPEIEISHRVVMIGDAGLYLDGDPTLEALGRGEDSNPASRVRALELIAKLSLEGGSLFQERISIDDQRDADSIRGELELKLATLLAGNDP